MAQEFVVSKKQALALVACTSSSRSAKAAFHTYVHVDVDHGRAVATDGHRILVLHDNTARRRFASLSKTGFMVHRDLILEAINLSPTAGVYMGIDQNVHLSSGHESGFPQISFLEEKLTEGDRDHGNPPAFNGRYLGFVQDFVKAMATKEDREPIVRILGGVHNTAPLGFAIDREEGLSGFYGVMPVRM